MTMDEKNRWHWADKLARKDWTKEQIAQQQALAARVHAGHVQDGRKAVKMIAITLTLALALSWLAVMIVLF